MSGLEMVLLIIGLIFIVASFIFSERFDKEPTGVNVNYELSDKQKDEIKNQIVAVFDDEIDHIKESTEASLDKLSNQKIMELSEYSETVLADINKNHQEVMFLYEMLNEKKKEVKNTVRDINLVQKEIKSNTDSNNLNDMTDAGFMVSEKLMQEENKAKSQSPEKSERPDKPEKKTVEKKTEKKTASKKAAPKRTETPVINVNSVEIEGSANNNEKILALHNEGRSNIDIARELGLGIGEVKLVIDLFTGRNA